MKDFYEIEIRTDNKKIVDKIQSIFKDCTGISSSTIRIKKDVFFKFIDDKGKKTEEI